MKVFYLGHACFRLVGKDSEVVIDPFTGIGLLDPKAEADLVLCTHGHRDHSFVGVTAKSGAEVIVGFTGQKMYDGVRVRGIPTYHDDEKGSIRGQNSVYVLEMDELVICHLGDLGYELVTEEIKEIGGIDVLFVPVGGFFTIDPHVASRLCDKIGAKISVPMHYRTSKHLPSFDKLSTVDDFASLRDNVVRMGGPELDIEPGTLPESPTTVILEF